MRRFACRGCISRSTNPEQRQSQNQLCAAFGLWLFLRKNFRDFELRPKSEITGHIILRNSVLALP